MCNQNVHSIVCIAVCVASHASVDSSFSSGGTSPDLARLDEHIPGSLIALMSPYEFHSGGSSF